jgi:DNA polymerase-3 subunit alpha
MEECKKMGIKVLGPDINESLKGFAVNARGEIRFGLGGLKGVGEAAVESIIEERMKGGPYLNIYDFIRRVNQRTVNKKTLENLALAGGFDSFTELHRAQYFNITDGESITGLEKIIKYGNMVQAEANSSANTLFGDMPTVMEIKPPVIAPCMPWPLTEQLDKEKEITGIYLSGHPLDHYKFEIRHYGINTIVEFNEIKDANTPNLAGKTMKLLCLVSGANHRLSKQGNKFGIFTIEDYSGKAEITLFGDNYVRFSNYLQQGQTLFITGTFNKHKYRDELEFGINGITLAENAKSLLLRQLVLEMDVRSLQPQVIDFLEQNLRTHPGKAGIKVVLVEPKEDLKISLSSLENGFEMNHELIDYLGKTPEVSVTVTTV